MYQTFKKLLLSSTAVLVLSSAANAQTLSEENRAFQAYAYGEAAVVSGITDFEARAANSDDAKLQLGMLQFLHALEGLQQDLHRYGAGNQNFSNRTLSRMVPIFRMPVPPNENPEQITYLKTRGILEKFVARLEIAENTLASVSSPDVSTEVDMFKLAVDADGNQKTNDSEKLTSIMISSFAGSRLVRPSASDLTLPIRFDAADVKWLQGYSNLLAGLGKLFLAFDYEATYEMSFHTIFGEPTNRFSRKLENTKGSPGAIQALQDEIADLDEKMDEAKLTSEERKRLRDLNRQNNAIRVDKSLSDDEKEKKRAEFKDELDKLKKQQSDLSAMRTEQRTKKRRLGQLSNGELGRADYQNFMEPIAFIHSINWPVEDAALLKEVRLHWVKVLELNHMTWELVQGETDNEREWLPNANQDSPFPSIDVSQAVIDEWLQTVKLAQSVLDGELLIPSLRFGKGINMKAFFENAESFDLVAFLTGHNSIDYVEEGPIIDESQFRDMNRDLRRNFGGFALWFN